MCLAMSDRSLTVTAEVYLLNDGLADLYYLNCLAVFTQASVVDCNCSGMSD